MSFSAACKVAPDTSQRWAYLVLVVRIVGGGDAAGFKANDSPLAQPIAIHPGIAEASADITVAIFPHHVGLRRDDRRVPIDSYFDIA